MAKTDRISGTKEWAVHNVNCVRGCEHNCRYCYARFNAMNRFKQVATLEEWAVPVVRDHDVKKSRGKKEGTIMFPTTHDILPGEVLDACMIVLRKLLAAGNDVLIVSKPHRECIEAICREFGQYKQQILFRFTIGAMDDDILGYWEPGAPRFQERFWCLRYACQSGFDTSVSVEPMLDSDNMVSQFRIMEPFVTDAIWIGKMNKIDSRVEMKTAEDIERVQAIKDGQTDIKIWGIYQSLKDEPKVKWKESIKEVVGLELATEAGADE